LTLELYAPIASIRCVAGPTIPAMFHPDGETAWRVVSHMSLNYLSLIDDPKNEGASGLREILKLYGTIHEARIQKQIEGVISTTCKPVMRRVNADGPLSFARGLEITVTFDENAFQGAGIFILGSVLERFFARYVSINSFTETVIKSQQRGEIIRWPIQLGKRQII
jgi:type VI secretion system protein ImpG